MATASRAAATFGLCANHDSRARGEVKAALALEETDGPGRRSADYAALAAAWARAGATMDALLDAAATLLHDNKQGDA